MKLWWHSHSIKQIEYTIEYLEKHELYKGYDLPSLVPDDERWLYQLKQYLEKLHDEFPSF